MIDENISNVKVTLPEFRLLRRTFFILWAFDMVTAIFLIIVPYASELNPITVFFYTLFGVPGVVFAASCYLAVIVIIGKILPHPLYVVYIAVLVVLYLFFVVNNVIVLLFDWALLNLFK